jgi:peroxiredoxin
MTATAKAGFVTALIAGTAAISAHCAWMLGSGGASVGWSGALVASAGLPLLIGVSRLGWIPRAVRSIPILPIVAGVGAAIALWGASEGEAGGLLPLTYALLMVAGAVVYVEWYVHLDRVPSPLLAVGQSMPDVVLERWDGVRVRSRDLTGKAAIWVFFRGDWCPFCVAQLRELARSSAEIEGRGARVILVSSGSSAVAASLGAPFERYVDPGLAVAQALGIRHARGLPMGLELLGHGQDTILPTTIVTDVGGAILFSDQTDDFRVRPEPREILQALPQRWRSRANARELTPRTS